MLAHRDDCEVMNARRQSSTQNDLLGDAVARRLSEAGVNRRPSAAQILTRDTDQFMVGQRIYVDGVKPGRIQYIGETKFGPGDWAGVVLDEPFGRNDGSVGKVRYFQCEPGYGVFSRLFRLTLGPIEGADKVLDQMRTYGYQIVDAPLTRKGSTGSGGGSRRDSLNLDDRRSSSPRAVTPEMRRQSFRSSPTRDRRTSLGVSERRGSQGQSPRRSSGKSPLASPRIARNYITGGDVRIDKDPDITTLTQQARRLSMGTSTRKTSDSNGIEKKRVSPRTSTGSYRNGSTSPRRTSDSYASNSNPRRPSDSYSGSRTSPRRPSDSYSRHSPRRSIADTNGGSSAYRRESLGLTGRKNSEDGRRSSEAGRRSSETDRRYSEAGFSRRQSNADEVLNHDPDSLTIGQVVWVDGNKQGRIAYIGNVQFAKGEVAGVHLIKPYGKNNGTVGGVKYFECEAKHGIFARLHRVTASPLEE